MESEDKFLIFMILMAVIFFGFWGYLVVKTLQADRYNKCIEFVQDNESCEKLLK